MKRSALSEFLRGVVIAALPVAAAGCCSDRPETEVVSIDGFIDVGDGGVSDAGALSYPVCEQLCPKPSNEKALYGCEARDQSDGGISSVTCNVQVTRCSYFLGAGGRPPLGLRPRGAIVADDPAGAFFAQMAHVEAAAIDGFVELATALAVHGAPAALVDDARRAAEDERRHARVAAAFARRFGAGALPPVEIDPVAAPTLETLALQNAREGCVLETYGAVVTQWQSRTAGDRMVRRAFVNIARDELRHAELAFAVARWLHARLDDPARRRVRDGQREAAAALLRDVAQPSDARLVATLGLPDRDAALRLVGDLRVRLWS
jgi:hypothetical protein